MISIPNMSAPLGRDGIFKKSFLAVFTIYRDAKIENLFIQQKRMKGIQKKLSH